MSKFIAFYRPDIKLNVNYFTTERVPSMPSFNILVENVQLFFLKNKLVATVQNTLGYNLSTGMRKEKAACQVS